MTTEAHANLGRITSLISFAIGTEIFGLYYFTSSTKLIFVGYGFTVIAGLINIFVLISILIKSTQVKDNRSKLNWRAGLMLLNIPVMLIYCQIAMALLDTMRVTFTNSTPTTLTSISITGCELHHINKLETGESTTIWIHIPSDCAINIEYLINGKQKTEDIVGYVTNNMGQKMKYNIGGENEELF